MKTQSKEFSKSMHYDVMKCGCIFHWQSMGFIRVGKNCFRQIRGGALKHSTDVYEGVANGVQAFSE